MALEVGPMCQEGTETCYSYDCRRKGNYQYMLKCVENARFTCWCWERRPGQAQKSRRHAEHVQTCAMAVWMAQVCMKICQ